MNQLQRLEKWLHFHKVRECEISHGNGYGAASWDVILWHEHGVVKVGEGYCEAQVFVSDEKLNIKQLEALYADDYIDIKVDSDDWIGLEKTLEIALDEVCDNDGF